MGNGVNGIFGSCSEMSLWIFLIDVILVCWVNRWCSLFNGMWVLIVMINFVFFISCGLWIGVIIKLYLCLFSWIEMVCGFSIMFKFWCKLWISGWKEWLGELWL